MGDFVGNFINGYIAYIITYICFYLTPITALIGMNGFAYDTVTGMGLYPEMVVSHETAFNWAESAINVAVASGHQEFSRSNWRQHRRVLSWKGVVKVLDQDFWSFMW